MGRMPLRSGKGDHVQDIKLTLQPLRLFSQFLSSGSACRRAAPRARSASSVASVSGSPLTIDPRSETDHRFLSFRLSVLRAVQDLHLPVLDREGAHCRQHEPASTQVEAVHPLPHRHVPLPRLPRPHDRRSVHESNMRPLRFELTPTLVPSSMLPGRIAEITHDGACHIGLKKFSSVFVLSSNQHSRGNRLAESILHDSSLTLLVYDLFLNVFVSGRLLVICSRPRGRSD